jgi:hypothetical protein
MNKTVVLIGKFLGELNHLKEALGNLGSGIRFISFTDPENALKILLTGRGLQPDMVLVDENFPESAIAQLQASSSPSFQKPPIVLFTRKVPEPASADLLYIPKCQNKKQYGELVRDLTTQAWANRPL